MRGIPMPSDSLQAAISPRVQEKRRRRREEILHAAFRAFRDTGYHATTLDTSPVAACRYPRAMPRACWTGGWNSRPGRGSKKPYRPSTPPARNHASSGTIPETRDPHRRRRSASAARDVHRQRGSCRRMRDRPDGSHRLRADRADSELDRTGRSTGSPASRFQPRTSLEIRQGDRPRVAGASDTDATAY